MRRKNTSIRTIDGLNILVGLWLAASAFVFNLSSAARWNFIISGVAVILLTGYNYYLASQNRKISRTSEAISVLIGLWVIISPFIFSVSGGAMWNYVISGLVAAILGSYNASAEATGSRRPAYA